MQSALHLAAEYLERECRWLDLLLERQVLRQRGLRDQAPDKYRGLYIADAEIDVLLAGEEDPSAAAQIASLTGRIAELERENALCLEQSTELRLAQIKTRFGLSRFECQVLIIAVAPELDVRYQTLYAYVQNDVTQKAPTVDLVLKLLCGGREEQWAARGLFSSKARLFRHCLLRLYEDDRERQMPLPARSLKVPERIAGFLLGHDQADQDTAGLFDLIEPQGRIEDLVLPSATRDKLLAVAQIVKNGGLVVLEGRAGSGKFDAAAAVCAELGLRLVVCDLAWAAAAQTKPGPLLRRECLLAKAGLYLRIGTHPKPELGESYAEIAHELEGSPFPIFAGTAGERNNLELLSWANSFHFMLEVPDIPMRRDLWQRELTGSPSEACTETELDALAGKLRFTPGQIRETVNAACNLARLRGHDRDAITAADIYAAVRARGNSGLEKLARKYGLLFDWCDLVLPERVLQQLREIANAVRFRHLVQSQWRFDTKVGKNSGLSVLFSGLSGTGKTMAASVLARELNLDLYNIDLSNVVSKYIGETEKNLSRIFDEAEHSSALLFFDEADALFGKRSEVKDAHDRYANIEVAFLLQRIEQFSGVVVLATNISRNIDAAFVRRIAHVVEFPFPDAAHRERIWRGMFPAEAPIAADVDFPFLARQFELSGGNIRNVVMAAAFLAAERGLPICMEHLARATAREFQKMGKLPSKAEFRRHFDVIAAAADDSRT
jgi:MoxR-like ATPase